MTANFSGIILNTSDNVVVHQGKVAAITITGPAEELARTETIIEKGRLVIRKHGKARKSWSNLDVVVVINVTLVTVDELTVNGSGDLHTEGTLMGSDLSVSLAGSGDLQVSAELTGTASTSVAGSGDVRLSGRCVTHTVRVAGSGDVRAEGLHARTASVKLSGSGDISVAADDTLEASISGSGDVRYAGAPKNLVTRITGSGSVAKL
ncbi:MAG: DUF2807 domain-containing protein [Hymenobacteraceae bacterium]|nr:DUF2807 domain-containing protein [Hymenobacteraceae bacterium]